MGETFSGVDYELGLEVGRGAAAARPGGRDAGPARAALDPHVRRRLDGHPRREDARSRRARTRLRPTCPRPRRRRWSGSRRSTASGSRRSSTSAGEPQAGSISCAPSTEAQTYGVASRPARAAYSRVTASARRCASILRGQGEHRAAEAAADHPGCDRPVAVGEVDEQVELGDGDLEVVAEALVSLAEEPAERGEVRSARLLERGHDRTDARVLGRPRGEAASARPRRLRPRPPAPPPRPGSSDDGRSVPIAASARSSSRRRSA